MIIKIKKYWTFLFVFAVWFVFACPYFIKNTIPFPSTYQQTNFAPWNAYNEYVGPVKNGAMPDIVTQIFPWRYFSIKEFKQGKIPLWNPSSFSGTPHLANYQSNAFSLFNIFFFVMPFVQAWRIVVLLQPLIAGFFMLLYVRKIGMTGFSQVISSLSFMFCGFITTWMAYATLGYAILFLPLSLYAIESYIEKTSIRYLFLLAFTILLSYYSGHFQTSVYFVLVTISYALYRSFSIKSIKDKISLFGSILFGLMLTMTQVLPSLEFYGQALRSNLNQFVEVVPWNYLPTFFAPDFFGNPVTRNDWFGHYAEWNGYAGIAALLFGLYSFTKMRHKQTIFFISLLIIAMLLAFPTPISWLIVKFKVPVLSTSAASRSLVLFSFALSVLAGNGLDSVQGESKKTSIIVWIFFSLLTTFSLWVYIFFHFGLQPNQLHIARQNSIFPTIGGVFCILVFLAIWKMPRHIKNIFFICLILFVSFDLLRFATKWMPADPLPLTFSQTPADSMFRNIADKGRIIGNLESGVCTYYGLQCLGGYDPLYIDRYGTFIASLGSGKVTHADRSSVIFPINSPYALKIMNLLNVRYVIHKHSDDFLGWTFPYWNYPNQFVSVADDGVYKILENKSVYPKAFLVNKYVVGRGDQNILDLVLSRQTDLAKTVVLESPVNFSLGAKTGIVKLLSSSSQEYRLQTSSTANNLLFISTPFYPGWKATIDGRTTAILRADFAFQAVLIPSGVHTVVLSYTPQSFFLGILLGLFGLIGLISLSF